MRITIVLGPFLPAPPVLGGAVEKVQLQLAKAYQSAGHEVTIISRRFGDFAAEEIVDGIKHVRIPSFDKPRSLGLALARDLIYALRVARRLPPADITVTNSFSLPLVLPRRTAGKIYVHVARFPKRQMALYFRADRLQAISNVVAAAIRRQAPQLAHKVVSIGYPVADAFVDTPASLPRKNRILFVGRLAREKGVDLLLRACVRARKNQPSGSEWEIRIVGPHEINQGGDGPRYLGELKALVRALGQSATFVGPVFDQAALVEEYRSAAIFVYPSLAEQGEALGLAALEAMAAGCAVITSRLECFDDFVEDGVNGLRFDHRSVRAEENLARLLEKLMADPDFRARIADAGLRTARQFDVSAIASRMLDDFELLLKSPGGRS